MYDSRIHRQEEHPNMHKLELKEPSEQWTIKNIPWLQRQQIGEEFEDGEAGTGERYPL
jgi:hypothetical protein